MRIVIIGDGKVGHQLATQLSEEDHDLTLIDSNMNRLKSAINELDVNCIYGEGDNYDTLTEAGTENADLVIACTNFDAVNMLSCLLAKKMGAGSTIARVRNHTYFKQIHLIKEDLGLTMAINPELAAADEIARVLLFPTANKIELFARGKVELVEYKLGDDSVMSGLNLRQVGKRFPGKVLICAVQRGQEVFIPNGDFQLQCGDKINIAASHKEVETFLKFSGKLAGQIKNVIIGGGGRITYYLARQLTDIGMQVKIIEKDKDRCLELYDLLPKATIIHGDMSNHEMLLEQGLEDCDAFVSMTGMDEENIIMSMFAQSKNVRKVVTKVNSDFLSGMVQDLGIDTVVASKIVTADNIVGYVRAMGNSMSNANIETVYRLINQQVEAIEFVIRGDTSYTNIPLKELHLKEHLLIACIVRKGKIIIPNGEDVLKVGDSVVIVTKNQRFDDLEDVLED